MGRISTMTQIFDPTGRRFDPADGVPHRHHGLDVLGQDGGVDPARHAAPSTPAAAPGLQARHRHPLGAHRDTVPQWRPARSTTPSRRSEELLAKVEETTTSWPSRRPSSSTRGSSRPAGRLADAGYEVIARASTWTFEGEPFGPMPSLLAEADEVVKLRAICARCGRDASRSQRLIDGRPAPVSAPTILSGPRRATRPAAATATRCPRACSSTGSLESSEPW